MERAIIIGVVLLTFIAVYVADPRAVESFCIGFILHVVTPIGAVVALIALIIARFSGLFKGW